MLKSGNPMNRFRLHASPADSATATVPGPAQIRQIGDGAAEIRRTPDRVMNRYRRCRLWRYVPKEHVYRWMIDHGIRGREVLDFGCGTGEITTQLAMLGARVSGLDVLPDLVGAARRRADLDGYAPRCDFVVGALETQPLGGRRFDYIVCSAVLHHVDLESTLLLLVAHLRPDGVLLVTEPIAFSPALQRMRDAVPVSKGELDPGERQLTGSDVARILGATTPIDVTYYRLLERLSKVVPSLWLPLAYLDRALLTCLPFLRRYAGIIVVIARKRVQVLN
jgi:SAM-dependent methyltransferase